MKRHRIFISIILLFFFVKTFGEERELKVLQFNIWQEGTMVENGFFGIVRTIVLLEPDLITFSEVRNYDGVDFIARLLSELKTEGLSYYGESGIDAGIISKYPIERQEVVFPLNDDHGTVLKAIIKICGKSVTLYSAHLDYTRYACYLPRGYDGNTWRKMDAPVLNVESILKMNRESQRDEAVVAIIEDAVNERNRGNIVILGGDFNEPSHLDWIEETKYLYGHNGAIVPWDCSILLTKFGFKDSYREMFPDPVTHPGFTFPSDNKGVPVGKLTWAPNADERERIDFVYFIPHKCLHLKDAFIVGSRCSIVKGKREKESCEDHFLFYGCPWPSDHKGVMILFTLSM